MTAFTFCVFLISILFCFIYEIAGVTEPSVYLGCYQDGGPSNRLFTEHHEDFQGALTPNRCNDHCLQKGFAYAGTEFSFRCFCSKTKPPDDKKTLQSECSSKCSGDESKTCGGEYRLAVFSTGVPDLTRIDGEVLRPIGCFKDSSNRILSDYRQDFPGSLTNQKCVKLCARKGYPYAGTEYGRECHCGNRKPSFKEFAKDEDCSTKCEGDSNELCGGTWRIFIFETPKLDSENPTEDGKYIGCYKDKESSRSLDGHTEDFGNFLTPLKCTGLCYSKGFLYSGTQSSSRCFCGDKPPNPNSKVTEDECYKPCTGNPAAICGAQTKNSIRETGIPDLPVDDKYLGCFNDHNNQIFKEVKLHFHKTNSPRRCMNFCWQLGFRYSGVEYGKECFCGNEEPKAELMVKERECNMPCSGDQQESCGAAWRIAVYATRAKAPVVPTTLTTPKPCVPSKTVVAGKDTVCKGEVIFEDDFNSPLDTRWSRVVMIPDAPAGLVSDETNHKQTNKTTNLPDQASSVTSHKVKTSRLVKRSEEDEHSEEGTVEFLGISVDQMAVLDVMTFGETIASRIEKLNCQNQAVARNRINNYLLELEMEESKNIKNRTDSETLEQNASPCPQTSEGSISTTSTSSSTPQDRIPEVEEEFHYAVFTSDPENSFTREKRLVIKPTFLNDSFVQTGALRLNGCTGTAGTRQCGYQAGSFNILPPVATARIHTRDSFSFRYGTVEIRAKLPLGDWLVPELWLEPRQHFYGPAYASGQVRIAMIRGNNDYKCNEQDFGSNRLESGVVMGPANNVQRRSLTTKLTPKWHQDFHNYTLIWTPDNISFKIDNQPAQDLVPPGRRLCQAIGFGSEECSTWSSGSSIAPFDQDFYISLGLSVGNARDFPDECINRGKPKPWKNLELKAMLKFWQDKENWRPTWTEKDSSLYVEHVRVTAL